jgi:hypothetical protein
MRSKPQYYVEVNGQLRQLIFSRGPFPVIKSRLANQAMMTSEKHLPAPGCY